MRNIPRMQGFRTPARHPTNGRRTPASHDEGRLQSLLLRRREGGFELRHVAERVGFAKPSALSDVCGGSVVGYDASVSEMSGCSGRLRQSPVERPLQSLPGFVHAGRLLPVLLGLQLFHLPGDPGGSDSRR